MENFILLSRKTYRGKLPLLEGKRFIEDHSLEAFYKDMEEWTREAISDSKICQENSS